jgi:hypothetical protein
MSDIGTGIAYAMAWSMVLCVAAGFALCLLLFFGVPWLWAWLKPFIHAWTG